MIVVGVLLAGGQSRRMGGGDKMLLEVAGRTLLSRVIGRAAPQTEALLLNANGDPARFVEAELPVAADGVPGFAGPLAGILTGLEWAAEHWPEARWLATFATDTPLFPLDLVTRLAQEAERQGADLAIAASGGVRHPVFGLWPLSMAAALRRAIVEEDERRVGAFIARYRVAEVEWPGGADDPFLNVNTPNDVKTLEEALSRRCGSEDRPTSSR